MIDGVGPVWDGVLLLIFRPTADDPLLKPPPPAPFGLLFSLTVYDLLGYDDAGATWNDEVGYAAMLSFCLVV